jgi:hypothetical protein
MPGDLPQSTNVCFGNRHHGRHGSGDRNERCIRLSGLRGWALALGFGIAGVMSIAPTQAQELCGGVEYPFPYTDVSGVGAAFCPGIMERCDTGVSRGTTPSTFSPNETVTRVQMTTFLQRSIDQSVGNPFAPKVSPCLRYKPLPMSPEWNRSKTRTHDCTR